MGTRALVIYCFGKHGRARVGMAPAHLKIEGIGAALRGSEAQAELCSQLDEGVGVVDGLLGGDGGWGVVEDGGGEVIGFEGVEGAVDVDLVGLPGGPFVGGTVLSGRCHAVAVELDGGALRFPRPGDGEVTFGAADMGGVVGLQVHAAGE